MTRIVLPPILRTQQLETQQTCLSLRKPVAQRVHAANGYNTQAALINRGLIEIMRLGKVLHADPMTFFGLAGMGDLILTCTGPLSRNRNFGLALGQGKSPQEALRAIGGVAEGYYTAKSAQALAASLKVEMPILNEVYLILYEGKNPKGAVSDLMKRELKDEW